MRFARLDLIRFGRFEDTTLEVPAGERDLVIVAGRNEAGKTTTMAAVEGLLFGFPARTGYAFRHTYDQLRVGAVIEEGEDRLMVRRRKGARGTLLDDQNTPSPAGEATLHRLLGAVDRDFFLRMFSLSHDRLAEGGRELAAAEGEVGEALFAAGSALRGLRARRRELARNAELLWTPRRAKTRRFYQALDTFTERHGALQAATKRPDEWKRLRRERDDAETGLKEEEDAYRQAVSEAERCSRVRRVLPTARRLSEIEEEMERLSGAVLLPVDAAGRLAETQQEAAEAAAKIHILQASLEEKRRDRDAVQLDPTVRERQRTLEELEEKRVKVAQMRLDLPKRRGERENALRELRQAAMDFGWEIGADQALLDRVPTDRRLADLIDLLQARGALVEAVKTSETALHDAEGRIAPQRARLSPDRRPEAASRLAATVRENPSAADFAVRRRDAEQKRDDLTETVRALRAGLSPAGPDEVASEAALRAFQTPEPDQVGRYRDRVRDLDAKQEEIRRSLADVRRELRAHQHRCGDLERAASGIARSSLDQARADRDAAWEGVKARLLNESVSGRPEALAERFEESARNADGVADRRFEKAEAAGQLAAMEAAIREREASEAVLVAESEELEEERERVLARWCSLWEGCPFEPLSPDRTAGWLETREELLTAYRDLGHWERNLSVVYAEERDFRQQLANALQPFGITAEELQSDPLPIVVRRAETIVQEEHQAEQREKDARADLAVAEQQRNRESEKLARARTNLENWETDWSEALTQAGMDPIPPSRSGAGLLTEMRLSANTVRDIEANRIGRMEQEIDRFEGLARQLVSELAPELGDLPSDEAARQLRERLRVDLARRQEREEIDREITKLRDAITDEQAAVQRTETGLASLQEVVGTDDLPALRAAIEQSDRKRALENERSSLLGQLDRDADGVSLAEVRAECEGIGPDEAKARETLAESRRKEIEAKRNRLAERLGETGKELGAFADDDAAARLAASREEALAGLRDIAERYTRLRSAEILLRWALERYRKEHQGPMLRRASDLFRTLTAGSFASLRVGFDSKDQLQLEAVRDGGDVVQVTGLSSGSEDQLYLALRVAAIEEYVDRAPPLPFVADDLFLNFDEERAAAGFRVLGELARKAQVLFFTHHEHLVGIAREVLGEETPVIRLERA